MDDIKFGRSLRSEFRAGVEATFEDAEMHLGHLEVKPASAGDAGATCCRLPFATRHVPNVLSLAVTRGA